MGPRRGSRVGPEIITRDLTKRFGRLTAVDGLDLEIPRGQVFGLLGPNGAGKTTTIRMLTGLSRPTRGTATIRGIEVTKDPEGVRAVMGIVPQGNVLDRDLDLTDNLVYHARLNRMVPGSYRPRITEVLELVGLGNRAHEWPLNLSGGMKRRFTIAKALLHEPGILVLDEPTTGLDPQSRRLMWDKLLELRGRGMTVLLTTHHMEEAEELCDDIAIIDDGRIITRGSPEDLKSRHGGERVVVAVFKGAPPPGPRLLEMGSTGMKVKGRRVRLTSDRPMELARRLISGYGDDLTTLSVQEPSLEEVFLNLTGRRLRD